MNSLKNYKGLYYAALILLLWGANLWYFLHYSVRFDDPLIYLGLLIQTHLYTGVFITAHDAIHGVVMPHRPKVNYVIGWLCATLFAFNNYNKLSSKHHLHHKHAASEQDPDYYAGNFFRWYLKFALEYVTIWQIILMAVTYNLLKLIFPMWNLILFWEVPAILSTLQLFYFGTYLPHRGEHDPSDKHKARSQGLNHWIAFFTCYFFGYHHEHHAYPYLPWWKLAEAKEKTESK
ncbi:fatty acid desaturase [Flectobacillus roseus]